MGQKRRRTEFESDLTERAKPSQEPNRTPSTMPEAADTVVPSTSDSGLGSQSNKRDATALADQEGWQVVGSSKKKKKSKSQLVNGYSGARLRFNAERGGAPVRIKDLQGLVLYTLADGVAPNWVAVRDAKGIQQVVVLMVPGMDKAMLEDAASKVRTATLNDNSSPKPSATQTEPLTPIEVMLRPAVSQSSTESLTDYIIPIKAPGDPKSGRMHSPLQTMLISPEDKKFNNGGRDTADVFQPARTPLVAFVHSAEELVEADYPVHPALFTNSADAAIEHTRREETGQSKGGGWVDTPVKKATPVCASGDQSHPVTQGLDAYALDCEMVLTTDDRYSLARISVVDWHGKIVMDQLVVPDLPIKNYFTQFSGITEEKLKGVTTRLADIQKDLSELFGPSSILIGHSLESDFNALKMTHPFVVDTSMVYPHPRGLPLRSSLKFLSNKYLKREIQKGGAEGHDSVEDARAVLDLVKLKCEKGPTYGTLDMNGESVFSRLARAGRGTAIVEYGTPERGFGRFASVKIGCQDDDEIADGLIKATSKAAVGGHAAAFTFGRLRDMEAVRGWNKSKRDSAGSVSNTPPDKDKTDGDGDGEAEHELLVKKTAAHTVERLVKVYENIDPSTLVIVYPGPGDMREVLRLQEMQRQYKREFKVKKWDELSVKWTDDEEQALRKAFNEARAGWALVCVK